MEEPSNTDRSEGSPPDPKDPNADLASGDTVAAPLPPPPAFASMGGDKGKPSQSDTAVGPAPPRVAAPRRPLSERGLGLAKPVVNRGLRVGDTNPSAPAVRPARAPRQMIRTKRGSTAAPPDEPSDVDDTIERRDTLLATGAPGTREPLAAAADVDADADSTVEAAPVAKRARGKMPDTMISTKHKAVGSPKQTAASRAATLGGKSKHLKKTTPIPKSMLQPAAGAASADPDTDADATIEAPPLKRGGPTGPVGGGGTKVGPAPVVPVRTGSTDVPTHGPDDGADDGADGDSDNPIRTGHTIAMPAMKASWDAASKDAAIRTGRTMISPEAPQAKEAVRSGKTMLAMEPARRRKTELTPAAPDTEEPVRSGQTIAMPAIDRDNFPIPPGLAKQSGLETLPPMVPESEPSESKEDEPGHGVRTGDTEPRASATRTGDTEPRASASRTGDTMLPPGATDAPDTVRSGDTAPPPGSGIRTGDTAPPPPGSSNPAVSAAAVQQSGPIGLDGSGPHPALDGSGPRPALDIPTDPSAPAVMAVGSSAPHPAVGSRKGMWIAVAITAAALVGGGIWWAMQSGGGGEATSSRSEGDDPAQTASAAVAAPAGVLGAGPEDPSAVVPAQPPPDGEAPDLAPGDDGDEAIAKAGMTVPPAVADPVAVVLDVGDKPKQYFEAKKRWRKGRAPKHLFKMAITACEMQDGVKARFSFRRLAGPTRRSKVAAACKKNGIDVFTGVQGASPFDYYIRSERALAAGKAGRAYRLAYKSNNAERSGGAMAAMTIAACQLGRRDRADYLVTLLPPRQRKRATLGCAAAGVKL